MAYSLVEAHEADWEKLRITKDGVAGSLGCHINKFKRYQTIELCNFCDFSNGEKPKDMNTMMIF